MSLTPKDDLTAGDIANLYNRLESVVDKVPSPVPPSDPHSPSCDCPHRHIFAEGITCQLCDREIPQLISLRDQKAEIERLKAELHEAQFTSLHHKQQLEKLEQSKARLEKKLTITNEQMVSLRNDVKVLNDKYVGEIERVAETQHAKAQVESELEELSQRLFEEANGMVATEKREKYNLQEAYRHLKEELKETTERLAAEEMQLQELRQKIADNSDASPLKSAEEFPATNNDPEQTAAQDLVQLFRQRLQISIQHGNKPPDGTDTMLIDDFLEFVESSRHTTMKKLYNISFMKQCLAEDIEPCLRFGPNSRLSARKIIDAINMNACFIESAPQNFAQHQAKQHFISETPLKISALKISMWERFSSSEEGSVFLGCQACGRQDPNTPLPYRFRISYTDDWACIDRYCRDRLVAVCEFYVFIRNVRQGYYNRRTIPDLYHESIRLRLQMFYARMGVLPWMLQSLGVKDDTLGKASEPLMSIPPTPTAIMTPSFKEKLPSPLLSPESPVAVSPTLSSSSSYNPSL